MYWSVLSLCMWSSMQWLRRGCNMPVRRKVLRRWKAENIRSAVAVVTGIIRTSCSRRTTSLNIILLLGIVYRTLARVLDVATCVNFKPWSGWLVLYARIRSGSIFSWTVNLDKSMSLWYSVSCCGRWTSMDWQTSNKTFLKAAATGIPLSCSNLCCSSFPTVSKASQ